ncbi:glycosyl hydrolase, partial [Xanthomonas sp. Kuri4-2]
MKTFTCPTPRRLGLALAVAAGLTLAWTGPALAAGPGQARPWMDTALSADQRADRLVQAMTEDEKFVMLRSYFGLGTDKLPKPEGALGSAGYVPGIERL